MEKGRNFVKARSADIIVETGIAQTTSSQKLLAARFYYLEQLFGAD